MKPAGRELRIAPEVWLAGLVLVGVALRAWHLGTWSLAGDEIFTYRDSIVPPQPGNPRPLIYFLNYYLVRQWMPLDEVGLRLLPALFGVLAIPAMYFMVRRAVSPRAGLLSALLLTFNAVHIYHSQSARYWSLAFLLSSIYPFAFYFGLRNRDRRWLVTGAVTGLLAILAHPASGLLFGGLGAWIILTHLGRDRVRRTVQWGTAIILVLGIAVVAWSSPILRDWILHPHDPRLRGAALVLSYVDGLTVGVVLTGIIGMLLLWRQGDRSLAVLLASLVLVPLTLCVLLSYLTAVSTAYIFPAAPSFFVGAGVFLDRLAGVDLGLRPRWLVTGTIAALLVAGGAPFLLSHYRDGSRPDFRAAATFLKARLRPGDLVFSDQSRTLGHYLPTIPVERLVDKERVLADTLEQLRQGDRSGTLWTVAVTSVRGGFRSQRLTPVANWVYSNCQLRASIGVPRLDFRQNQLQIFRCPPAEPP